MAGMHSACMQQGSSRGSFEGSPACSLPSCCVADVGAPLEVDGEQDAEIGVVLDLLEDGVVQGVVEEDS